MNKRYGGIRMDSLLIKGKTVLEILASAGHDAYFVGGCVRDRILALPIQDVDIATSARPEEVMQIFPKTVPTGLQHGTVLVIVDHTPYEVTTFRAEGEYDDYRRPSEVTFIQTIEADLSRRDFTMNAMAMDQHFRLIDPFDGKGALREKVIRTVGEPVDRFREDPLRIIRALRFSAQLHFTLDDDTLQAVQASKAWIAHLSIERIAVEWSKWLTFADHHALDILQRSGVADELPLFAPMARVLPSFVQTKGVWTRMEERWAFLAILAKMDKEAIQSFLRRWKQSRALQNGVLSRIDAYHDAVKAGFTIGFLYQNDLTISQFAWEVCRHLQHAVPAWRDIEALYENMPIHHRKELAISGKDVLAWSRRPAGPWVENVLRRAEEAVLHGTVENSYIALQEWYDEHD
ncbi:CCA tRNA nucleotidyltransferase [Bacillaceae bacterium SIJ1]|uniref:CCA tRNA nucleotidyltransferase n=1 Tax=Litoribacterium kuwaitense TaxID=1398745 RepID=UPI0013EC4E26|nr:CCA tRNA nucleotidyltransferase [Litoribacterium kuwaitense]NGP43734.1 CCA tRNA nucleotidyltransferase [Litoribacterium kuwaitense]